MTKKVIRNIIQPRVGITGRLECTMIFLEGKGFMLRFISCARTIERGFLRLEFVIQKSRVTHGIGRVTADGRI